MGKANKQRECPAAGRAITAVECGRNRGVVFDCPEDCPFCPWTAENYDALLEIEDAVDAATWIFYKEVAGVRALSERLTPPRESDGELAHMRFGAACCREFFFRDLGAGKRLFEVWRESGWRGLSKDGPFVASLKAGTRFAFLEVRRVVDGLRVECVDLFREGEGVFTVCDRSFASQAVPCVRVLGWACKYPFFHRIHGSAQPLPHFLDDARGFVAGLAARLGGPGECGPALAEWLGMHAGEFFGELDAELAGRAQQKMWNSDIKECEAVYRWRGAPVDLGVDGRPDFFLTGPDAAEAKRRGLHREYVWLRTGESAAFEERLPKAARSVPGVPGEPVWGNLRVFADRVEISALSEALFRPMQEMVEVFFGKALELQGEVVSDLAKQRAGAGGGEGGSGMLVSTNFFREKPADMAAVLRQGLEARLRHVMDDEVPALGGLTPREAARRAESRPVLVEWMKGYIASMAELQRGQGISVDLGWMLDELGLGELRGGLPAVGAQPQRTGWWRVLDEGEVRNGLRQAASDDGCGPGLEFFPEVLECWENFDRAILRKKEQDCLVEAGHMLVDILVPRDVEPGEIDLEVFRAEVGGLLDWVAGAVDGVPNGKENVLLGDLAGVSVQPAVLECFAELLVGLHMKLLGKRWNSESVFASLLQLEALMRCMRRVGV
jgi:hypothetical protein